ncbi:GNAT family N-acetyltransferase [Rhodococcus coprophilus]|uniref:GNAT family acetyltransferase n=1 Tax=Rhodococcus coprophilus TaxID=38310 RepID=A0A2X4UDH5_9NOCA|nr:GNAT family N-acetyltransferase [Rhodococcus coprophilus]MBM7459637.1 putative GNAT family acetyltransferase [Rhodococcus coprophilus]SQI36861.1 GNAT family acetyltransferase [Rhodococcus coprophilus]
MLLDTSTSSADVSDNADQNRFELRLNGDLVGILGYYDTNCPSGVPGPCDPVVDFMHTVIVEDFGHRGLAAVLVGGSLDIARQRGWRVRPVCTYVQRFLDGHAGYENVVVPIRPAARKAVARKAQA